MNQTVVSGLGNIYVNEALFLSKIKPEKFGNKLANNEIIKLLVRKKNT